jgi:hypothetical protein
VDFDPRSSVEVEGTESIMVRCRSQENLVASSGGNWEVGE